jgi:predicted DNA-binding protein YlxM (UPF0122 family)
MPERNIAVYFLGDIVDKCPDALNGISPRNGYIIFSSSDDRDHKSLSELGKMFGISRQGVHDVYKRTIKRVWLQSSPELQRLHPLDKIRPAFAMPETLTEEHKEKIRASSYQAARERWQDPSYRQKMVASRREEWQRRKQGLINPANLEPLF